MFELFLGFENSGFGFGIFVVAGVAGGGDIVQCTPLSVIVNYVSGALAQNI